MRLPVGHEWPFVADAMRTVGLNSRPDRTGLVSEEYVRRGGYIEAEEWSEQEPLPAPGSAPTEDEGKGCPHCHAAAGLAEGGISAA